jgi:hypothetical protein
MNAEPTNATHAALWSKRAFCISRVWRIGKTLHLLDLADDVLYRRSLQPACTERCNPPGQG